MTNQNAIPLPANDDSINALLSHLEPEMSGLVSSLRDSESWAHLIEEIPGELAELAKALPSAVSLPVGAVNDEIVVQLIEVLAHLDAKACLAFILWMEIASGTTSRTEHSPGWGAYLFSRAVTLEEEGGPLSRDGAAVAGRLRSAIRGVVVIQMFIDHHGFQHYKG